MTESERARFEALAPKPNPKKAVERVRKLR
jgi:hypothetical protein